MDFKGQGKAQKLAETILIIGAVSSESIILGIVFFVWIR